MRERADAVRRALRAVRGERADDVLGARAARGEDAADRRDGDIRARRGREEDTNAKIGVFRGRGADRGVQGDAQRGARAVDQGGTGGGGEDFERRRALAHVSHVLTKLSPLI